MHERIYGMEIEYNVVHMAEEGFKPLGCKELSELAIQVAREELNPDIRGGTFWCNGGRLYEDLGHVEWAGPECRSVRETVVFDKASEWLLDKIASATERRLRDTENRGTLFVAKNNVDNSYNTFGCHENYLVRRNSDIFTNFEEFRCYLFKMLTPFLVSRTILCGSGCVVNDGFHISQRAPFINRVVSEDAHDNRPIINTREESHVSAEQYRRLHIILADANMAEQSTFLKLGTMSLVLEMIEDTYLEWVPELKNPVPALRDISEDTDLQTAVDLLNGDRATALEIQRCYLDAAVRYYNGAAYGETREILNAWEEALKALSDNPLEMIGRLDWVTKKHFLELQV